MVARDRHRLAVLEHRRRRADLAHRVDQPADHLERGLAAAEDEGGRVDARGSRGPRAPAAGRRPAAACGSRRGAGRARAPARAGTRGRAAGSSRTAARPAGGLAGATTRRDACSQPVAQRKASSRSASRPSRSSASSSAGSSTSSTERSTERTARLSSITRSASVSSKWSQASTQPAGRARPLAALARQLDGRGDVVGLEQGAAQRLQLGQVVLAVAALRAARLRVAEAALPAAQRVGAHAEQLGGCVRPDTAHMASVPSESQQLCAITSHVATSIRGVLRLAQVFGEPQTP